MDHLSKLHSFWLRLPNVSEAGPRTSVIATGYARNALRLDKVCKMRRTDSLESNIRTTSFTLH